MPMDATKNLSENLWESDIDLWGWLQVATKIIIPNSIRSSWWNGGSLGRKQIAVGAKILESNAIWILFIPWDCRKQILLHVQTLLIWRIQLYQKPTTNTIAQHVPCNIFIHFPKFSLASATGLLTCTLLHHFLQWLAEPLDSEKALHMQWDPDAPTCDVTVREISAVLLLPKSDVNLVTL